MKKIAIWDLGTRVYHWAQAIVFTALMVTGVTGNGPHTQLGLALFTLLTWRFIWGIVGSETSIFQQFVASPKRVWAYIRGIQQLKLGHNPLGGWMVITLLTSLLLQCLTGMLLAGMFDGLSLIGIEFPDVMYGMAEQLHVLLADGLPLLIMLHVGAVIVYKFKSKPLLWAMLSGYQRVSRDTPVDQPVIASHRRAIVVLMAATSVTIAIVAISMV